MTKSVTPSANQIEVRAYACSSRPNALWSAAQFNSAAEKNRTECDIPLVSLKDHQAAVRAETERCLHIVDNYIGGGRSFVMRRISEGTPENPSPETQLRGTKP